MPSEVKRTPHRPIVASLLALAVAFSTASCGGGSHSKIALAITVKHYVFKKGQQPREVTERFSLGCEPVSGTLPLAARVCADIGHHRQAMLAPRQPRSTCGGSPFMPVVEVSVKRGVSGGGFSGSPGCGWPGGTPIAIYYEASIRDTHGLARNEPLLRCEDDLMLAAMPTPWASVAACTHGLWTPSAEKAIRQAETAPQLASLAATDLFPADPGVRRCRIHGGGPAPGRVFMGLCGVRLTGPASRKIVHFVESWAVAGRVFLHHWIVRGVTVVAQSGAAPPQAWS